MKYMKLSTKVTLGSVLFSVVGMLILFVIINTYVRELIAEQVHDNFFIFAMIVVFVILTATAVFNALAHRGVITKLESNLNNVSMMRQKLSAMLDASPMSCAIFDENINVLEVNQAIVDILKLSNKQEYIDRFFELSPEFQPDGMSTQEKAIEAFANTVKFGEGRIKEWVQIASDGEAIPFEIYLKSVEVDKKNVVIVYAQDLREHYKLEDAIERVQLSSQAKTRFLAHMSHEIRTPISAVLGLSEIQLRNQIMSPQTEEVFAKIYDSAKSLLNIVNDILDFSKIESGKMSILNTVYDVASLVGDAAQLHLIYLENKDVKFQLNVDENLPSHLEGDLLRIKQIITNLLTNAFKYTETGLVTLSLQCETAQEGHIVLIISIQDTGAGMTEAQIKDLSNEYVRLHEHEKPLVNGTGLGFPIVCNLVQMMDAHIDLQSEVGKGTHVVVRIPQKMTTSKVLGKELACSLQNFESGTWLADKEFEFEPEPMPYGNVLVVDDVEINLLVAEGMLEAFKLNIELCHSGANAIEKVKQGKIFDIIFMDHMMPEMDGIETTKILRDMGYSHPIVALTANAVKGQDKMFMNNGFSGFMSKPIDINRLNSYLIRFIKDKDTI